jgi:UDP-N-acetylglucosamine 4,6-dehydratase
MCWRAISVRRRSSQPADAFTAPEFRRQENSAISYRSPSSRTTTRFWITLEQGTDFVLSSLAMTKGGEIFIPKIPSLHVVDLARNMAPDAAHDIIGIRPGEKIHEVMITSDDARNTVEMEDRYIIRPPRIIDDMTDGSAWAELPAVAEDFSYSSDANFEWLGDDAIRQLLARVDAG